MIYKPHEYQTYAAQQITEKAEVGLLLDMGLGKTVITLSAIDELAYNRLDVARVLVIAPLRVAEDTWTKETSKWQHLKHLRVVKVLGPEKKRIEALNTLADVYVINRENVVWLTKYLEIKWFFVMIVIDELSSFKDSSTSRFKALKKVRPKAERVVGLTGTPTPNSLLDLWPQVYLLDQGERLGRHVGHYREQYFYPGAKSGHIVYEWKIKSGAEEAIYEQLSDLCVSMKAKDWLDLPERVDNIYPVKLPEKAMKQYKELEKELVLELIKGDVVAGSAAVLSNKLLQIACGSVYDENGESQEIHTAKLEALAEIQEAANGKPLLVFYSYKHDEAKILKRFKGAKKLETSKDIDAWNAGKVPMMIAHPASAGHGLNLQAGGSTVVWYGLTWSLELYQQANARLHRQGQTERVIVHHIVAEGTVDEDVMRVLANKAKGQDALLEAVKARIKEYEGGFSV